MPRDADQPGRIAAELAREGEYWTVVFGDRQFRMRDTKGFGYLAELLSRPGRSIAALALSSGRAAASVSAREAIDSGLVADAASDAGPLLDESAKRSYRRRVAELREEIAQADAFHDLERAARARVEYDTLVGELATATGLGGRDRRARSPAERARLNVSRAIKSAITRIDRQDHELGEHLTASVQTGRTCVYRPDAATPVHWTVTTRGVRRLDAASAPPQTRYARSDLVSVAYQVLGEGPPDLVFVPGFLSHVDLQWTFPAPARFFRRLAGFSRLILYDKRGQGLSDRPAGVPTLEEDMEDLGAALDAAASERAVLFGYSEGGPMSLLFAATYPERVTALILNASFASGPRWLAHSDELGWGIRARVRDMLEHWGEGRGLDVFAPSAAAPDQARRFGAFERAVGSPAAMEARWETCSRIDVTPVLETIRVPTLVLHRAGERTAPAALAREMAGAIPQAEYVEVPGIDHMPWVGDADRILAAVEEFVTRARTADASRRVLTTLLFVHAAAERVREHVRHHRGREIKPLPDGLLAAFDGPGRAIRCARAIAHDVPEARQGIHTGECVPAPDDLEGVAVDIGARIAALAQTGEVLVSRTVTDLVVGSGIAFEDRGVHHVDGVPGRWQVLALRAPEPADREGHEDHYRD